MSCILITNGNLGAQVAEMLATRGESVRVIPGDVTPNLRRSELGMERVAADLGEAAYPAPEFAGVDKLFSVTPYQSPGHVDARGIL